MFLGFDPGGAETFGCAVLDGDNFECETVSSVDDACTWAIARCSSEPSAAGIDSLLFWQTGKSGWRGADIYLRRRYPAFRNSVLCSNGLYGSMAVQGVALAFRLRHQWPRLFLTETHPKLLWAHFDPGPRYPRTDADVAAAVGALEDLSGADLSVRNEHEFDAALSAWAARQASLGVWRRDLRGEKSDDQVAPNLFPIPDVEYRWPD